MKDPGTSLPAAGKSRNTLNSESLLGQVLARDWCDDRLADHNLSITTSTILAGIIQILRGLRMKKHFFYWVKSMVMDAVFLKSYSFRNRETPCTRAGNTINFDN